MLYEVITVDAPAGIERGFQNAVIGADEIIVVTNPEVSAVRDADRIVGIVESMEKKAPRLIINRIKKDMVKRGDMLSVDDVLSLLEIELIGLIPVITSYSIHYTKLYDMPSRPSPTATRTASTRASC